jgi:hypothetical protein
VNRLLGAQETYSLGTPGQNLAIWFEKSVSQSQSWQLSISNTGPVSQMTGLALFAPNQAYASFTGGGLYALSINGANATWMAIPGTTPPVVNAA